MMSCKLSIRILAATLLVALVANSSHAAPSGGQVIDGKRHTLGKRDAEEKQEHPSKIWVEDEVPLESYKPMH